MLSDLDASKSALANMYLIPMLIAFPALTLFETGNSIYRGTGDTQTPFRLLVVSVIIKLTLTPILIFGWFGFPRLEMAGAPVAFGIAYGFAFIIGFIYLKKRQLINSVYKKIVSYFKDFKTDKKITFETIRIGVPLSLEGLAFVMIYVFVSRYVSDFGTVGLAALGIGHRSEAIPYQVGEGFSITASILVGQNVGAKAYDKAEKAAWRVLLFSWVPMIIYGIFLFFYAEEIAGFFTTDLAVIETAAVYNRIAAFGIFFAASESVFTGSFAGAGNSIPPLVISLPITALRIPISAIFSPVYGMNGIWLAIFSTSILKGIIFAAWFKKGNWKKRKFTLDEKRTATGFIEKQSETIDSKQTE
jgi:putative MATE family efflux protein